jgi:hypothetical protein
VGDLVYLKLQPYIQNSFAARSNQKLAFKFFGPSHIIGRVGAVAYKLELPPASAVHPIFHVSQLKQLATTLPPQSCRLTLLLFSTRTRSFNVACQQATNLCYKDSSSGRVCLALSPTGRTWKLSAIAFLVLRLGDKSLLKGRGLLAVHHHPGSPWIRWIRWKPVVVPRERLSPARVCMAQSGMCERCI